MNLTKIAHCLDYGLCHDNSEKQILVLIVVVVVLLFYIVRPR